MKPNICDFEVWKTLISCPGIYNKIISNRSNPYSKILWISKTLKKMSFPSFFCINKVIFKTFRWSKNSNLLYMCRFFRKIIFFFMWHRKFELTRGAQLPSGEVQKICDSCVCIEWMTCNWSGAGFPLPPSFFQLTTIPLQSKWAWLHSSRLLVPIPASPAPEPLLFGLLATKRMTGGSQFCYGACFNWGD